MTLKALIVDDEPQIRDLIATWLQDAGFETRVAAGGLEGIKILTEFRPDLAISDVWMSGMDGYNFCRMARRKSDAAIVMMTGVSQEAGVLRDAGLDIDGYFVKPIQLTDFMQCIEEALARRQLHNAKPEVDTSTILQHESAHVLSRDERLAKAYPTMSDEDKNLVLTIVERLSRSQ